MFTSLIQCPQHNVRKKLYIPDICLQPWTFACYPEFCWTPICTADPQVLMCKYYSQYGKRPFSNLAYITECIEWGDAQIWLSRDSPLNLNHTSLVISLLDTIVRSFSQSSPSGILKINCSSNTKSSSSLSKSLSKVPRNDVVIPWLAFSPSFSLSFGAIFGGFVFERVARSNPSPGNMLDFAAAASARVCTSRRVAKEGILGRLLERVATVGVGGGAVEPEGREPATGLSTTMRSSFMDVFLAGNYRGCKMVQWFEFYGSSPRDHKRGKRCLFRSQPPSTHLPISCKFCNGSSSGNAAQAAWSKLTVVFLINCSLMLPLQQMMGPEAMGTVDANLTWDSEKVCRNFLCGTCPHALFTNTVSYFSQLAIFIDAPYSRKWI